MGIERTGLDLGVNGQSLMDAIKSIKCVEDYKGPKWWKDPNASSRFQSKP